MRRCVNCGAPLEEDSVFCPNCGNKQPIEDPTEETQSGFTPGNGPGNGFPPQDGFPPMGGFPPQGEFPPQGDQGYGGGTGSGSAKKTSLLPIIIIAVVVVLLIAGAVIFFLVRKNNDSESDANDDTETEVTDEVTETESETEENFIVTESVPTTVEVVADLTDPPYTTAEYYVVTTARDPLNLRSAASTDSPTIGKIPKGTVIQITEIINGFGYTVYNGTPGYVSMMYLTLQSQMPAVPQTTAYYPPSSGGTAYRVVTHSGNLRIRSAPSESGVELGSIPKNTVIYVTSIVNGFGYTTYNGISGYVSMGYLSLY